MRRHRPDFALPSWRLVASTAGLALVASLALALSRPAAMDVDGQPIVSDVAPVTAGGVAYLPIRAVDEAAGAATSYDPRTNMLTVQRGTETLVMKIGDRHATLDGRAIRLLHAPFTVRGRAMVGEADLALALDAAVTYDARRGRIDVRTPGAVVAGAPDEGSP